MPIVAASVRTRVVSWKGSGAEGTLGFEQALVIPRRTGAPSAGFPPIFSTRAFLVLEGNLVDLLTPQEYGITGSVMRTLQASAG